MASCTSAARAACSTSASEASRRPSRMLSRTVMLTRAVSSSTTLSWGRSDSCANCPVVELLLVAQAGDPDRVRRVADAWLDVQHFVQVLQGARGLLQHFDNL